MAKNFGVQYGMKQNTGDFNWNLPYNMGKNPKSILEWISTFYVHPDSLSTFKPQEGDLVGIKMAGFAYSAGFRGSPITRYINKNHNGEVAEIIQRNGKPFIMPEVEA